MAETEQPNTSRQMQARIAHREQVWAAILRAVTILLEEAESALVKQLGSARLGEDGEREELLERRIHVLTGLRRQICSSPPEAEV